MGVTDRLLARQPGRAAAVHVRDRVRPCRCSTWAWTTPPTRTCCSCPRPRPSASSSSTSRSGVGVERGTPGSSGTPTSADGSPPGCASSTADGSDGRAARYVVGCDGAHSTSGAGRDRLRRRPLPADLPAGRPGGRRARARTRRTFLSGHGHRSSSSRSATRPAWRLLTTRPRGAGPTPARRSRSTSPRCRSSSTADTGGRVAAARPGVDDRLPAPPPACRDLPGRSGVPGRRRRPHPQPGRRPGHEHRHPGRGQPGLEARPRAAAASRPGACWTPTSANGARSARSCCASPTVPSPPRPRPPARCGSPAPASRRRVIPSPPGPKAGRRSSSARVATGHPVPAQPTVGRRAGAPRRGPRAGDRLPDAPVSTMDRRRPCTGDAAPGWHLLLCGSGRTLGR